MPDTHPSSIDTHIYCFMPGENIALSTPHPPPPQPVHTHMQDTHPSCKDTHIYCFMPGEDMPPTLPTLPEGAGTYLIILNQLGGKTTPLPYSALHTFIHPISPPASASQIPCPSLILPHLFLQCTIPCPSLILPHLFLQCTIPCPSLILPHLVLH